MTPLCQSVTMSPKTDDVGVLSFCVLNRESGWPSKVDSGRKVIKINLIRTSSTFFPVDYVVDEWVAVGGGGGCNQQQKQNWGCSELTTQELIEKLNLGI